MRDLPTLPSVLARRFVSLALILIGISGCSGGGGGGSASVIAVSDSYVVNNPGDPLTINAPGVLQNDSGSGLTAQLVSGPGTLTLNPNGSFTITGGTPTSFTYRAVNSTATATATATIGINQSPVANNACNSTARGIAASGFLSATDPEGATLTYALASGGTSGLSDGKKGNVTINSATGQFTYTPCSAPGSLACVPASSGTGFQGMDKFTFRATDPLLKTSTGVVSVLIDGAVRIMPLGDSITAGITDGNTSSPPSLTRIGYRKKLYDDLTTLSAGKYGINFVGSQSDGTSLISDPNHEGHPGFCDDGCSGSNIADNININQNWLPNNPADIILLHIGTNGFNTSNAGVNTILNNINTWATANYPTTVFVARIIPTRDGTLDVNTFNDQVEMIDGDRSNVKTFNVNQQTGAGLNTSDPSGNFATASLMTDNLHPTQTGYNLMADKWKADLIASGVLPSCPP